MKAQISAKMQSKKYILNSNNNAENQLIGKHMNILMQKIM